MPGYVSNYEAIKAKGYDVIACVSVNDPFVMDAWGQAHKADNKVRLLADTNAELTKVIAAFLIFFLNSLMLEITGSWSN